MDIPRGHLTARALKGAAAQLPSPGLRISRKQKSINVLAIFLSFHFFTCTRINAIFQKIHTNKHTNLK